MNLLISCRDEATLYEGVSVRRSVTSYFFGLLGATNAVYTALLFSNRKDLTADLDIVLQIEAEVGKSDVVAIFVFADQVPGRLLGQFVALLFVPPAPIRRFVERFHVAFRQIEDPIYRRRV